MTISRDSFDESKRYIKLIKQQGTPAVDSELNELQDIRRYELLRLIAFLFADRTFQNAATGFYGFEILESQSSPVNSFTIKAGAALVNGERVNNSADIEYTAQETAATLTPPNSGTRNDIIYLHVFYDEVGIAEDSNLALVTPNGSIETSKRLVQKWLVKVVEGSTMPGNDSENNYFQLAEVVRTTSTSILQSMISNTANLVGVPAIPNQVDTATGYDGEDIVDTTLLGFNESRPRTTFVRVFWGDTGSGTGATNSFTINSNRAGSYESNEMIGQILTDANGDKFEVSANTPNVLTVAGTPASGNFMLGPDAESYIVILVPLVNGVEQLSRAITKEVSIKGLSGLNKFSTEMQAEFNGILSGVEYNVYVASQGVDVNQRSAYCAPVSIQAGGIDQIEMESIVITAQNYGVDVTWPKVDGAVYYEYCWNEDNVIADFNNPRHKSGSTDATTVAIKAQAGKIIQVTLRAIDSTGKVSSNIQSASGTAGGIAIDRNVKMIPVYFKVLASDITKANRLIVEIPTENAVEIIRMTASLKSVTVGIPSSVGGGKLRVYRQGDESGAVSLLPDATGLKDQAGDLIIPAAATLVFDAWDPAWDVSAPDTWPAVEGVLTVYYLEGEFISRASE